MVKVGEWRIYVKGQTVARHPFTGCHPDGSDLFQA